MAPPARTSTVGTGSEAAATPVRTVIPVALGLLPLAVGLATGGYAASTWMTIGIALGALLIVVRVAAGADFAAFRRRLPPTAWAAMGLFGALAVLTLLSAVWASDKGAAMEEGTRTAVYFMLFVLALAGIETTRQARLFATTLALAAGALALGLIVALASSASPQDFFNEIKLSEPIGYSNAEGSYLLMPAFLALHLASRLSTRAAVRPVLFVSGLVLLQAGVLTQSRGAFWAAIGAFVVYLIIVPNRPRALLWWGLALALLVATFPYLNALQSDLGDKDYTALAGSVHEMTRAVVASLLVAGVLSTALVWVDTHLRMPPAAVWVGRALAIAAVILFLGAVVDRFPQVEDPLHAAQSAWSTFKGEGSSGPPDSDIRLLDLRGTYRYELWQVAWTTFRAHPVLGVGADNYMDEWIRLRPLLKDVRQPHNLYLRLLAETGVLGLSLFAGGVIAVFGGALRQILSRRGRHRSLLAGMLAASSLFLIHATVEWVWHVPAGTAGFFLMLGVMAGLRSSRTERGETTEAAHDDTAALDDPQRAAPALGAGGFMRRMTAVRPLTIAAIAGAAVLVLAVPQVVSSRLTDQAASLLALQQNDRAASTAAWAARANPLQEEPLVIRGRALARQGDIEGSEAAFVQAVDKHPNGWLTYLRWGETWEELGLDPDPAYREAARLNPLSPKLQEYVDTTG